MDIKGSTNSVITFGSCSKMLRRSLPADSPEGKIKQVHCPPERTFHK